jgi:hypothetical protein
MRQWSILRINRPSFNEGEQIISFIYSKEGKIVREDRPARETPIDSLPPETLGWWQSTIKRKPPTQKELNERLERLLLGLKESNTPHKASLQWLIGLYLTRKRLVRQEGGAFIHIKSGERIEADPSSLDPQQISDAMSELMQAIS